MTATISTLRNRIHLILPGGSGVLGGILARHFHAQGHRVTVLARNPKVAPWRTVAWDGRALGSWVGELEGADAVINLAGRSVDCRYNKANRQEILDSRIVPTRILGQAIARLTIPPRIWMNASTATIYRHSFDRAMDEETGEIGGAEPGTEWQFSIEVATRWEDTFFRAYTPRTRKIALRSAMVMTAAGGGAFEVLLRLVRLGLGGSAGSGEQFVSWVHEIDFVRAVQHLIARDSMEGIVNVASPHPVPNHDFMRAIREGWETRFGVRAPKWMLGLGAIFLRTETELILKSRRVVPGRLLDDGFQFAFPEWPDAARDLVDRWKNRRSAKRETRATRLNTAKSESNQ
jgi:uncharacterized protein